jgi:hypothetical protein
MAMVATITGGRRSTQTSSVDTPTRATRLIEEREFAQAIALLERARF